MNDLLVYSFELEAMRRWPEDEGAPEDCWHWSKTLKRGYPMYVRRHGKERVNRLVVMAFHGGFEGRKNCALHRCDNKLCWRPSHIYAGTQSENMSDARRRVIIPRLTRYQNQDKL